MNSYYSAILKATSNNQYPEYSDMWRSFHPTSMMLDSDYCLFTLKGSESTKKEILSKDSHTKHFSQLPTRARPTLSGGAGVDGQKILYVPVTRKVSATDCTNRNFWMRKVTDTDDSKPSILH